MLHAVCCGEEAGARNLLFFRVKWLQPAMKRYLDVPRVCGGCGWGSFGSFYVFCNNGCSCVRSSMRFLKLWLQIALEWLHECCMPCVVGRKPEHETLCFSRVKWLQPAMKGTSMYLVCAAGAAGVVWFLLCVLQQWLFLCA